MPLTRTRGVRSIYLLAIFLLLVGTRPVMAQLVADFTPSVTQGCSPLAVSFTNTIYRHKCYFILYLDLR